MRGFLGLPRSLGGRLSPSAAFATILLSTVLTLYGDNHPARAEDARPPTKTQRQFSPEKLTAWIEELQHDDEVVRRRAARALGELGSQAEPAVAELIETLSDDGKLVAFEACQALAKIGPPAIPALTKALAHNEVAVRSWAARGLEEIGPEARAAIPALIDSLRDHTISVDYAASALASVGMASVGPLLEVLRDPQESTTARARAAHSLGLIGPRASVAVPLLIEALEDRRERTPFRGENVYYPVCNGAIVALGAIGPDAKAAVPVLAKLLSDGNAWVRSDAIEALAGIGPDAASAVPRLITALGDKEDEETPVKAAKTLGEIGPAARESLPVLIQLLCRLDGDSNSARRDIVTSALVGIGPDAISGLTEAYRKADADDRPRIIRALGAVGAGVPTDVYAWLPYLGSHPVRAFGTEETRPEEVIPTLVEALADEEGAVRLAAVHGLGSLGPSAKLSLATVAGALQDRDPEVRVAAAVTLMNLGPSAAEAVPALVEALSDRNARVRKAAAWALTVMGPPAEAAVEGLALAATRDRDREVRAAAALALRKIRRDSDHRSRNDP